jgi:hypothetical protein
VRVCCSWVSEEAHTCWNGTPALQKLVTRMQVVSPRICVTCVGSEVLTTLVMKECSPLKLSRRFGGTCHLHLQDRRTSHARNRQSITWSWYFPPSIMFIKTHCCTLFWARWIEFTVVSKDIVEEKNIFESVSSDCDGEWYVTIRKLLNSIFVKQWEPESLYRIYCWMLRATTRHNVPSKISCAQCRHSEHCFLSSDLLYACQN